MDVKLLPLLKSLLATLVTGGVLYLATDLVLTGSEGKLLLVAKCCGLGVVAVVLYVLLMLLTRQEDLTALVQRYRKGK